MTIESPLASANGSSNSTKVDHTDYIILGVVAILSLVWFTKGKLWALPKKSEPLVVSTTRTGKTRNIVEKMREQNKNAVVFYGSQTGTAEDYATRLAKEGHQKYGLRTMTADFEDYDYDTLDEFPEDALAFFVVATYGEGEPTDNAVAFFDYIKDESSMFGDKSADDNPLATMKYVAFGLGNKTYEKYNEMVKICDSELKRLGATRLGDYGMGDDGDGTMEEDFLSWKENMWSVVAVALNLEEHEAKYEETFETIEDSELTTAAENVFLGEPSKKHLTRAAKPFNVSNPFLGPLTKSQELFKLPGRNCMHIEFDLKGSGMKYQTGDHIAVWPMNPDQEIDRILQVLGLSEKRDTVVRIKALDSTAKVPVPQPTTYDSIFRYYLEICGPVSRQLLTTLAQFCPEEAARQEVLKLAEDKVYFQSKVSAPHYNLAQMLQAISTSKWDIPFSVFLESFGKLQPRFYSISSSNLVQPTRVSITAVVESKKFVDHKNVLNGVTTNYLLALSQAYNGRSDPHPYGLSYQLEGPRTKYASCKVPLYIRQSNFKLPNDPSLPVVMVGPGTGVAPFRAFIQERAHQARDGQTVGKTLLFFGCRSREDDFIYQDEWEEYKKDLGDNLVIDVAFSREGPKKVYVQHRLAERSEEVRSMLSNGYFYLCGDAANMAKDVNKELGKILGDELVQKLRTTHRHQEDVWS